MLSILLPVGLAISQGNHKSGVYPGSSSIVTEPARPRWFTEFWDERDFDGTRSHRLRRNWGRHGGKRRRSVSADSAQVRRWRKP